MSYPNANNDGSVAVASTDEPQSEGEASLFSVLDAASCLYQRVEEILKSVGLSFRRYEVLAHLSASPSAASLDALAEAVRCEPDEVAARLDRLSRQGLVLVTDAAASGAPAQVTLTRLGAARAAEGRAQLDAVLLEFAASFGALERRALRRLLDKAAR